MENQRGSHHFRREEVIEGRGEGKEIELGGENSKEAGIGKKKVNTQILAKSCA